MQWGDGPTKTTSGEGTSAELDVAIGASAIARWRRLGGEYGRHGDDVLFFVGLVFCDFVRGDIWKTVNKTHPKLYLLHRRQCME